MSESPISANGFVCGLELAVNVRDKASARQWYADKMGIVFDELDRAHISGVTLVLWGFSDAVPGSHVVYQLVTPNLEKVHVLLAARGVRVSAIDGGNWNFVASDRDGNRFVFYTPRKWLASGMSCYPQGHSEIPG